MVRPVGAAGLWDDEPKSLLESNIARGGPPEEGICDLYREQIGRKRNDALVRPGLEQIQRFCGEHLADEPLDCYAGIDHYVAA